MGQKKLCMFCKIRNLQVQGSNVKVFPVYTKREVAGMQCVGAKRAKKLRHLLHNKPYFLLFILFLLQASQKADFIPKCSTFYAIL